MDTVTIKYLQINYLSNHSLNLITKQIRIINKNIDKKQSIRIFIGTLNEFVLQKEKIPVHAVRIVLEEKSTKLYNPINTKNLKLAILLDTFSIIETSLNELSTLLKHFDVLCGYIFNNHDKEVRFKLKDLFKTLEHKGEFKVFSYSFDIKDDYDNFILPKITNKKSLSALVFFEHANMVDTSKIVNIIDMIYKNVNSESYLFLNRKNNIYFPPNIIKLTILYGGQYLYK